MNALPTSPKIARAQAMRLAFCLSFEEIAVLAPVCPSINEGLAWERRTRKQQKNAMLWVLNRLYFALFCDTPLFDRDPQTRRALILDFCRDRTTMLEYSAKWSKQEIADWLREAENATNWTDHANEF